MLTDLVYEHTADLRREAAAPRARRVVTRADRVARPDAGRATRVLATLLRRNTCPMGCEA